MDRLESEISMPIIMEQLRKEFDDCHDVVVHFTKFPCRRSYVIAIDKQDVFGNTFCAVREVMFSEAMSCPDADTLVALCKALVQSGVDSLRERMAQGVEEGSKHNTNDHSPMPELSAPAESLGVD